ncbi:MAG: hypothetical protein PVG91_02505 [Gammaproteobacteria bacterium]|jgi:hypothetical protein
MSTTNVGWRRLGLAIGATALLALSGCGEPVIFYEPGEYKGQPDPLLAKSGSGELDEQLRSRFDEVQARE